MTIQKGLRVILCGVGVVLLMLLVVIRTIAQSPQTDLARRGPFLAGVSSTSSFPLAGPTPAVEPGMNPHERLKRPPMSDPPTQTELGHGEYWMSCMVCHGDRGQGLTDEWRSVLDPADMNCWQSKCHAPNHPPEGFEIPRQSPLVIGPGALTGYRTAADLFEYISTTMPWAFPGLFEDETYWQLTAYLADANKIDLGKEPLGPDNADRILLLPQLVQTFQTDVELERIVASVTAALLLGAAILYWLIRAL
jgi:mono/diheme cytochrome c family protein